MNKKKPKKIPIIDLHGKTSDEVFDLVDKFITKNVNNGVTKVHIMTGRGKGVVKKKVREYLKLAGYSSSELTNENGQKNEGVLVVFIG